MQVGAPRIWPTTSNDLPPFPLDPALSSFRSSSPSLSMNPDNRNPNFPPQHRAYSDPTDHHYYHPNLVHYPPSSSLHNHDSLHQPPRFPSARSQSLSSSPVSMRDTRAASPSRQLMPPPALYTHPSQIQDSPPSPDARNQSSLHSQFPSLPSMPRLPPILQVEKQQVTTSATQAASASRRRNEAHFMCPVPGCGSTFTRRFNLRGHLRSHTEERPFVCEWPGCGKGFARQHDCKRHQNLHYSKAQQHVCHGCRKTFSRLDALNRHLRSEGGLECRQTQEAVAAADRLSGSPDDDWEKRTASSVTSSQSPR